MHLAPVMLADAHVRLEPFDPALYGAALRVLAEGAPEQFVLWSHRGPGDWIGLWLETIAARTAAGTMIPFSVLSPDGADFLGVTSYLDANAVNRSVEIGMTVYAPHAAGTAINPAAKRLLLAHAFGEGAVRVQFQVDDRNKRSQAAVLKLGAQREGLLRNHRTLPDGFVRDTAFFSIIDTEWPDVKTRLDARLAAFG
ncbi:GNAT family protein [Hyphomonas oceanitis]|uniref:GNAT family N-acetyltransferase n=1 Tax=Hyphomonas oceanitis TaxID=81033 RepID=UPI003002CD33